jgi:hypothetical protein
VLGEQLGELKQETHRVEAGFCADAGLAPGARISPARLGELIKEIKRELRDDLLELQQELRMLADPANARRWLKRYRGATW